MSNEQRSGPFSKEEKQFIIDNCKSLSAEEIAKSLRRNIETVKRYIHTTLGETANVSMPAVYSAQQSLKNSPVWKELKNQFTEDELNTFLYHWSRLIAQFDEDVYPTEELQIIEYIRTLILTNRVLTRHKKNLDELESLEKELGYELQLDMEEQDQAKIAGLRTLINALRAAQDQNLKDYKDLIDKKSKQEASLKGTREQRVKDIEQRGVTLTGLMKELTLNKEFREKVGIEMEKMRLAAEAEVLRLSELHKYVDGSYDIPFLTPETVKRKIEDQNNE